jgi:hypothetical protein
MMRALGSAPLAERRGEMKTNSAVRLKVTLRVLGFIEDRYFATESS